jgi:tRNA(Arg) A34 adenosine deaminase TadA
MTRHAEIEAIRLAVAAKGPDLSGCTLVTTVEPCPMCFTAAWLSHVSRIIYGATMSAVADATKGAQREVNVAVDRMNAMSSNEIAVAGGVLEAECLELFLGQVV